jgi:hypothetical protein
VKIPEGYKEVSPEIPEGYKVVEEGIPEGYKVVEEESDVSWFDEAMYAYDSTSADYENWALALEAKMPRGNLRIDEEGLSWDSPEELYGDEFANMSYDERLQFLAARRQQAVEEEYSDVIAFQEEHGKSSAAEFLGAAAKTIATPTSLFVLGKGLAGATATGAILGAETELAAQTAKGDYDLVDVAKSTGVGAVGGAVANKIEKTARKMYAKSKAVKHDKALSNKAKNLNHEIMEARADGLSPQDSALRAQKRLGLNEDEMTDIAARGELAFPSDEAVAKHAAAKESLAPATQKKANVLERVATPISSRIRSISEPVFGRLRKLEMKTHEKVASHLDKSKDFMVRASRLAKKKDKNYLAMERALMNGERDQAKEIAAEHFPDMIEGINNVSEVLDEMYDDLVDAGVDLDYSANYFPRKVKDMEGLMTYLGRDLSSELDRYLDKAAAKKGFSGRAGLDVEDREVLINAYLSGDIKRGGKLSLAQSRTIEELQEGMEEFYYSAADSLNYYINKAVREAEKRRFFGKNATLGKDGKLDISDSVGALVAEQGDLTTAQLDDLTAMLTARFGSGEIASSAVISGLRNIQTAALLGQYDSALIQLGDVGTSVYMNGMVNTLRGLGEGVRKKGITSAEELGVIQNIAADIEANGIGANLVDKALRYSGFRAVDRLGKDTLINAAHIKNTKIALKKPEEIVKRWGKVFGDETDSLIDDLKNGRNTENVRLLLFNELSDAQPISLSEMPEAYLNQPNGRILYALKSFALKQLDLVKRTSIDEMRSGNYIKGFTNLARYAAIMGLSGGSVATVRDWMQTKEFRPEKLPDKSFETLMGIMFLNEYARNKYIANGDFAGYLTNLVAPAAPEVITTSVQALMEAASNDETSDPEKFNRAIKDIPVMGKLAYYWMFGGAEKKLERERKKEIQETRRAMGLN